MSRTARIDIPNVPHRVKQRGNNRQDVFFTTDDRHAYLALLLDRCTTVGVEVLGYCLMTNHVHLILIPPDADALAHAVGRTHFAYTQHVNRLHARCGHLWQGRFYSSPLDETHLWRALAYIERNPVRARLVRLAWRWPWSSAAAHVATARDTTGLLNEADWHTAWTPERWRQQLTEPTDDAWRLRFWRAAHTGRPLADDAWLAKLESSLGRRLRPNPVGRPRRPKQQRQPRRKRRSK